MTVLGRPNFFGQTLQATASGAIADGDPVVLNADGTVSAVSTTGDTIVGDGEAMFLVGTTSDSVFKYTLGTGFDLSTASYSGDSFSLASQAINPGGIEFSSDGLKMFAISNFNDTVFEYDLTVAYDITTASYSGTSFSVSSQESNPTGFTFNPDGTRMFVVGIAADSVIAYYLSSGFDISTASYANSFSVSSQESSPRGVAFNTNGTKMFVVGSGADAVFEYNLSSAFNVSSASYSGTSFSVSGQDTSPEGITFNGDGTKMFIVGDTGVDINEYSLSSGFDISTASYTQKFSVSSQESNPRSVAFSTIITGPNLTTAERYIGISAGAYADGTLATIQLVGFLDDAQSGLLAGQIYYVQTDGTLATTPDTPSVVAGYAVSPTKILVKGAYSTLFH